MTSNEGTTKRRYNVRDAAEVLGISPEAVRTRLSRGSLDSVREGRRVYVLLEPDLTRTEPRSDERYIRSLEERVEHLRELLDGEREANRENRRIIAALTSRIPELESGTPSEGPQSSQEATERPSEGETPGGQERGFWGRLFGR